MLSPDQARAIADSWRNRFVDEDSFEKSWQRFFEMVGDPTAVRLQNWLAKDQAKDAVLHAGIVKEPLLPTQSRYEQTNCSHCAGHGYVRVDVPISDARFGKALRCPDCNGGLRSEVIVPGSNGHVERTGNWCWRCGAAEDEPAGELCRNPGWHISPGIAKQLEN